MKAGVDEGLPRSIGNILTSLGFTSLDIRDHGLRGKSDADIFRFAQKHNAVLFSADKGFSNTLTFPLGTHHGIVVLRFPNEMPVQMIDDMVKKLLVNLTSDDYKGNLVIISPERLRIRRHKSQTIL